MLLSLSFSIIFKTLCSTRFVFIIHNILYDISAILTSSFNHVFIIDENVSCSLIFFWSSGYITPLSAAHFEHHPQILWWYIISQVIALLTRSRSNLWRRGKQFAVSDWNVTAFKQMHEHYENEWIMFYDIVFMRCIQTQAHNNATFLFPFGQPLFRPRTNSIGSRIDTSKFMPMWCHNFYFFLQLTHCHFKSIRCTNIQVIVLKFYNLVQIFKVMSTGVGSLRLSNRGHWDLFAFAKRTIGRMDTVCPMRNVYLTSAEMHYTYTKPLYYTQTP